MEEMAICYIWVDMFVRCKRNKSGSTSVQIIDKSSGKFRLYETVGSSHDQQEIDWLIEKGKRIIEGIGAIRNSL